MRVFRFLMILLLLLVSPALRAQTAAELLNWTRTHLDRGNCDEARETYALYKEKVPQGNAEIERRIAQCRGNNGMQETRKYRIGDDAKDIVHDDGFMIAYLDDTGQHGFAIKKDTKDKWGSHPTINDCKAMYPYRYTLGLYGEYFTCEEAEGASGLIWNIHKVMYTYNFTTGQTRTRIDNNYNSNIKKMLISRF